MSKVSIITPAYNASVYISEAIDSVISQTYKDWELLVTDDCSTDSTLDVVAKYSKYDSRIRALRNPENTGPAGARNNSLSYASGRYIAFLDSDDFWIPEKLEKQISFMTENRVAFSYTQYRRIDESGYITGHLIDVPDMMSYTRLLCNTAIATSTVMLDSQVIGDVRMQNTYYDDFVLWLEILKKGVIAYGLHDDLMRYRVLRGSVSRNKWHSAKMVWKTYRDIEGLSPLYSALCFLRYSFNGFMKYRKF